MDVPVDEWSPLNSDGLFKGCYLKGDFISFPLRAGQWMVAGFPLPCLHLLVPWVNSLLKEESAPPRVAQRSTPGLLLPGHDLINKLSVLPAPHLIMDTLEQCLWVREWCLISPFRLITQMLNSTAGSQQSKFKSKSSHFHDTCPGRTLKIKSKLFTYLWPIRWTNQPHKDTQYFLRQTPHLFFFFLPVNEQFLLCKWHTGYSCLPLEYKSLVQVLLFFFFFLFL